MKEYNRLSRSGLFTIELLAAAGIFIICSAICTGLFIRAEVISAGSADLNRAVAEARNAAECWKAARGNLDAAAALCGTAAEQGALCLYYDRDWTRTDVETRDGFRVELSPQPGGEGVRFADVTAHAVDEPDEPLLIWHIAVLTEVTP